MFLEELFLDFFGVNLCIDEFDYEFGWMVFQNGEFVGFVYDGVYCDLDVSCLRYGEIVVCEFVFCIIL